MAGRHFEDWTIGDRMAHDIRRTVTETDNLLFSVAPVFIGDTLRAETEVVGLKDSRSRPLAGLVTFAHKLLNQRDEVVCSCQRTALVARRP